MSKKKARKPARVDYWHDPAAPKPTSRKPSASVIALNSAGEVLLLPEVRDAIRKHFTRDKLQYQIP